MRNYLLILGLLMAPSFVVAQKVKYKDVFPLITNASDEVAKYHLIKYIFTDLQHPNANLRLAMLYENDYLRTDVLTDYPRAMGFAEKCKLQYIKCKAVVDEKEVSRNEEYYSPFATSFDKKGRPTVDYISVKNKIDNGYDSAVLFIEKLPPIYENFTIAVNNYGEAYRLFNEINNTYKSLDDLLMLYDEKLEKKLLLIKAKMDTSLARFNVYQGLIRDYPINNYNQRYSKIPIVYYRLDGLAAQANFLENNITLWNYSQWVDEMIQLHNSEIRELRRGVAALENNLKEKITELENSNVVEEESFIVPDKELVYQLNKYDFQSVVLGLLDYKTNKQGLIKKKKQKIYYDTAAQQNVNSRFNFYSELIRQQVLADSLLGAVNKRLNDQKIARHQQFLKEFYGGEAGLKRYVENEKNQGLKDFNFYKLTLRNDILNELKTSSSSSQEWIKYKKLSLPNFLNENDSASLANKAIITKSIDYRADSSFYIAGFMNLSGEERNVGYVARLSPDKKVQWLNEVDISIDSGAVDASTQVIDIEVTKDGCAVMARSEHIFSPLNVNTFIYFNDEGERKVEQRLEYAAFPRKILYDQDNSRFIFSLRGELLHQDIYKEDDLHILTFNTIGDKLWERRITFSGTFEDMLNMQDGYLIIGNYTTIKDLKGNPIKVRSQDNITNAFVGKITHQGDVTDIAPFEESNSYYVKRVYKVNDGNINLFGFTGSYSDQIGELSYTNDNLFHLMINKQLQEIRIR